MIYQIKKLSLIITQIDLGDIHLTANQIDLGEMNNP